MRLRKPWPRRPSRRQKTSVSEIDFRHSRCTLRCRESWTPDRGVLFASGVAFLPEGSVSFTCATDRAWSRAICSMQVTLKYSTTQMRKAAHSLVSMPAGFDWQEQRACEFTSHKLHSSHKMSVPPGWRRARIELPMRHVAIAWPVLMAAGQGPGHPPRVPRTQRVSGHGR